LRSLRERSRCCSPTSWARRGSGKELGDEIFLYYMRTDLALLLLMEGKHDQAAPVIRRCLLAARRIGLHLDVCELLLGAACCAAWQGDHLRAARLHGSAGADLSATLAVGGISWSDTEQRLREQELGRLRELMGDEAFDAAYRAGAGLSRTR
jgi:hypothetical protein